MRAWLCWAVFGLVSLAGCANYSTLQDPETIPAKDFQLTVAATFNAYTLEGKTETTSSQNGGPPVTTSEVEQVDVMVPALALGARYGASERLELHGVAWLPLGATIGTKYMLVGDREQGGFAFSPGLDVSAPMSVSANDESVLLMDVYVPLHMGYRAAPGFALYWTPKYVLRIVGDELGHAAGGTLGAAIGEKTQFLIEGGVLYDTLYEQPIINGAIGFAFR